MAKKWTPPKFEHPHCAYCEQQEPIPSQDREIDAILDDDGYFHVLDNSEDSNVPEKVGVFQFLFCPLCDRRMPDHKGK